MLSSWAILGSYITLLSVLALYGAHRVYLLMILHRSGRHPARTIWESPPRITVQLPVYNEPAVIERLIDAAAQLHWPQDRLQIQILDDSTDITSALATTAAAHWRSCGVDIEVIRRTDRAGYKAGALAHGLVHASGEFIAILDADFLPSPDFLHQVMESFTPDVGMVQARWGHLNRDQTLLTRAQAILLDGHFVIEHAARHQAGHFFNFNGTAGIWRRSAIEDAGGWAHDTVTEDLDLSYRAQLKGWRFVYMPDVVVPGELPMGMPAFLTQQHRWSKGTIQTARKLLGSLLRARLPLGVRLEALVHLSCPIGYPLMVLLALLLPPAVAVRASLDLAGLHLLDLVVVGLTTCSLAIFFSVALARQGGHWQRRIWEVTLGMVVGAGMAASQSIAVLDGLLREETTFVRTPKHGAGTAPIPAFKGGALQAAQVLTWALGLYYAAAIPWAMSQDLWGSLPFMLLFGAGFWSVGFGLLPEISLLRVPTGARTETDEVPAAK